MKLTFFQRLKALFTGKIPDPPKPDRVVVGTYNGFTLLQWQESPERIRYAQRLFQDSSFRDILAVLTNARPRVGELDTKDPTSAATALGKFLGYDYCLKVLLALPHFPERPPLDVEADYSATPIDFSKES